AEFARNFFNAYQKCLPQVSIDDVVGQLENLGFFELSGAPSLQNTVDDLEKQIISTLEGKENPSKDDSKRNVEKRADPVMMFNGQFVHEVEDIHINGADMDFVFKRTYKNKVTFNGPLGFKWTHYAHIWLREANQTIFRSTGDLREEPFTRRPRFGQGGSDVFDYWIPPDGKDGVIFREGNSFVLRLPNCIRFLFEQ